MASTKQEIAQQFLQRRNSNLEFFREHYPALYKHFKDLKMTRAEVQVGTESSDVDLKVGGEPWYQGAARAFAQREVQQFLKGEGDVRAIQSMKPVGSGTMPKNQFATNKLSKLTDSSPVSRYGFQGYRLGSLLPSIVFMGVGLGYHIEEVVRKVDLVDVIIFEPDPEIFAGSLLTVDWAGICQSIRDDKGGRLRFLVAGHGQSNQNLQSLLEQDLRKAEPLFPVATVYFNHRSQAWAREVIQLIRRDLPAYAASCGNYDDELGRLNNMLHNLAHNFELVTPGYTLSSSKPVLIVGSGPSIDTRIEQIKALRSSVVLVSAGTGIRALVVNGLSPDYHVELDPQYVIYQHLSQLKPEEIKDTTLLAIAEINPLVPALFKQSVFYAKSSSPYAKLFGIGDHSFSSCNPTCTNAAFVIFVSMGFSNLFLFGCDYGFQTPEFHHASDSVHGVNDQSDVGKAVKEKGQSRYADERVFQVNSVTGDAIQTRADYHSAKLHLEKQIGAAHQQVRNLNAYNCSDGQVIEGAKWLSPDEFKALVQDESAGEGGSCERGFELNTITIDRGMVNTPSLVEQVAIQIENRAQRLLNELDSFNGNDKRSLCRATLEISKLNREIKLPHRDAVAPPEQLIAFHLMVGSVRVFLLAGYSHAMTVDEGEAFNDLVNAWKGSFEEFLQGLSDHFRSVVTRDVPPHKDPWVTNTEREPEQG